MYVIIILSFLLQTIAHGGFAAHTSVILPTSGHIAIKDIRVGDTVLCHDGVDGYRTQEIIAIQSHQVHDCVCVILDNAHIITAHNQKFYLADHKRWKIAGYLQPGDCLLGRTGEAILVKYVLKIPRPIQLYDLTVKEYHNFLVSRQGIVAHNFVPAVAVGISIAFGSGAVELAGITLGIGALTLGLNGLVSWLNNRREEQEFWKMDPVSTPNAQQGQQDCVFLNDFSGQTTGVLRFGAQSQASGMVLPVTLGSPTICQSINTENSLEKALKTIIADSVTQTVVQYASNKLSHKIKDRSKEKENTEVSVYTGEDDNDGYKCPFHVGCRRPHPHGLYLDAGYHHFNSKGNGKGGKSPAPGNGQLALDLSLGIPSNSGEIRRRVGLGCMEIVEFKPTGTMKISGHIVPVWHGYSLTWQAARDEVKSAMQKRGWSDPRGNIKWPL